MLNPPQFFKLGLFISKWNSRFLGGSHDLEHKKAAIELHEGFLVICGLSWSFLPLKWWWRLCAVLGSDISESHQSYQFCQNYTSLWKGQCHTAPALQALLHQTDSQDAWPWGEKAWGFHHCLLARGSEQVQGAPYSDLWRTHLLIWKAVRC